MSKSYRYHPHLSCSSSFSSFLSFLFWGPELHSLYPPPHRCSSQHGEPWCSKGTHCLLVCWLFKVISQNWTTCKLTSGLCWLQGEVSLPCEWRSCYIWGRRTQLEQSWDHGSVWSACPATASVWRSSHTGCRRMVSLQYGFDDALPCDAPAPSSRGHS